jgi:hypothetical protein
MVFASGTILFSQPRDQCGVLSKQEDNMRAPRFAFSALALALISFVLALPAVAQAPGFTSNGFATTAIHGVPPSVTSFGFGGQPGFHGVPPSVTSLNFGNAPFRVQQHPVFSGNRHRNGFGNHGLGNPLSGNVVAVPYAYPVYVMEPGVDDSMEQMEPEDYRGGPTIFDRRGPGEDYSRPAPRRYREASRQTEDEEDYRTAPARESAVQQPAPEQEVAEQPRTLLVFKDGSRREVANYAIVAATLYDLSAGRTQKVALAELDLQATVKQNDQRGVEFQLPAASRVN